MVLKNILASLAVACLLFGAGAAAQVQQKNDDPPVNDYIVGPQDVLMITSYDQIDLTGKFSVESDGTFTYPFIGRIKAAGLTLREVENA